VPIKIYNSLKREKENFEPLNPPNVNIYTCGVTVYDECHIGHARSLYIFDIIRRYLQYRKYKVNFVRNITDIDDKIINRAKELKIGWRELTKKYIDRYYEDLNALGIGKADYEPRATENIEDMVKDIQALIDKGYAYATDTGVYFNVRKFKEYGKLSSQSVDQMLTGVRKEPDETKNDPLDFALWKKSKPDEPFWPSPWGNGRPGWHIECSVMSQKFLKTETLDIHAGGRDLIFPHHENEIAQAEALTGKPFAKYWIHHGLLTINSQKMSKSAGNFVTVKDFLDKDKDADYLKLLFLSTHYRHPVDYTEEKIEEMKKEKDRFVMLFRKVIPLQLGNKIDKFSNKGKDINLNQLDKEVNNFKDMFEKAMDDDFNAPIALATLFDLATYTNKLLHDKKKIAQNELEKIFQAKTLLQKLLVDIFGLTPSEVVFNADTDFINWILRLKDERDLARKQKDFKKADEIRKILEEKDIILEDTKDGKSIWRPKV